MMTEEEGREPGSRSDDEQPPGGNWGSAHGAGSGQQKPRYTTAHVGLGAVATKCDSPPTPRGTGVQQCTTACMHEHGCSRWGFVEASISEASSEMPFRMSDVARQCWFCRAALCSAGRQATGAHCTAAVPGRVPCPREHAGPGRQAGKLPTGAAAVHGGSTLAATVFHLSPCCPPASMQMRSASAQTHTYLAGRQALGHHCRNDCLHAALLHKQHAVGLRQ